MPITFGKAYRDAMFAMLEPDAGNEGNRRGAKSYWVWWRTRAPCSMAAAESRPTSKR